MEKQSKYLELKNTIKDITKNLFEQALTLLEVDKLNKLSKYTIANSELTKTLNIVNQTIMEYETNINNSITGNHKMIYLNEYMNMKNKLEKLIELRTELEACYLQQIKPFDDKYEELLSNFKESLIGNSLSLLFDRLLSISGDKAYELLENKDIYIDLKRCINLERERKKNIKIIELCDDILSYRNTLRENLDRLVEYNKLSSELISKIGCESIEELKKKKERLMECNKKMLSAGLSNLLLGLNTNLRLVLDRSNISLNYYLQDIKNPEDLTNYFMEIKDLRDRIDRYMKRTFVFEEKYLKNTVNELALEIATTDLETAKTLVSLAESDGTPSLRTLLVEMVLAMRQTPISAMDIDKREFSNMEKHFLKTTCNAEEDFSNRYNNIMNNNKKEKVI